MKKAFVTGGAGHVGGNLVRQLLSDGWDVRCLIHKDTRALDGLSVVRVQGSTQMLIFYRIKCQVVMLFFMPLPILP